MTNEQILDVYADAWYLCEYNTEEMLQTLIEKTDRWIEELNNGNSQSN
jgi:hypothetical protein